MIDLNEISLIFLNILKIFLIELKFILLYCINRITPSHLIYLNLNLKNKILYRTNHKTTIVCHFFEKLIFVTLFVNYFGGILNILPN